MKRLISLVIFVIVAIIAWWSTSRYFGEGDLTPEPSPRYIEIFMNEFEMIVMNESGEPAYTLNGKHLERYNDSDDTRIDLPVINMLESGNEWLITADFALLNDKTNTIQLRDNVFMQQQNIEPAATIRTQSMTINTETQIAQTDVKVEFTQGNSQLTSTGMIYNNKTSELELTSSVNGHYLPYE